MTNNNSINPLAVNSQYVSLPQPDLLKEKIEILLKPSREVIGASKYKNTKNFYYFNSQELFFQEAAYTYVPYLDATDKAIFEARIHVISLLNHFFFQLYPTGPTSDYFTSKIPELMGKLYHHFPKHVELKDQYKISFGTLMLERLITLAEYHLWKVSPPHPNTLPADTIKEIQEGCEDNYTHHIPINRLSTQLVENFNDILNKVKKNIEEDSFKITQRFDVGVLWELQDACGKLIATAGLLAWEVFEKNKKDAQLNQAFLNTPIENEIRQHMVKRKVEIEETLAKRAKGKAPFMNFYI